MQKLQLGPLKSRVVDIFEIQTFEISCLGFQVFHLIFLFKLYLVLVYF